MLDFITTYWSIILSIGGGLVWLVRLEAKNNANSKSIRDTKISLEERIKGDVERRITELEKKDIIIEKMAQDIVEIKTNIMWIKEQK